MSVLFETDCPKLNLISRGKVRDNYVLGPHLGIVATDRISAFDVVSGQPVPEKGRVLTELSVFWFKLLANYLPALKTHFITADWAEIVGLHPEMKEYEDQLAGRTMLVWKLDQILPIEAIVRWFLYGSGLKDYLTTGQICGITLPPGLLKADRLPVPIFTPSTKADLGQHDVNTSVADLLASGAITREQMVQIIPWSLLVMYVANSHANPRNVLVADTKLEWGLLNGELVLADEILTPDSSRFWPADLYVPGQEQPSLDKQPVRDYLETLCTAGQWDKKAPMPVLPENVIADTTGRYLRVLEILTN